MSDNQQLAQSDQPLQYQLRCPGLPLAIYREVAAHLQQVDGVEIELLRQQSQTFDYNQSQIGGLRIRHTTDDPLARQRVEQILTYYGDRYEAWEAVKS